MIFSKFSPQTMPTDFTFKEKFTLGTGDIAYFGNGIAIDGNTIAVGAPLVGLEGLVKVYERNGNVLTEVQTISTGLPSNPQFGANIAIDGNVMAISEPLGDTGGGRRSGQVHMYTHDGLSWIAGQIIPNPLPFSQDTQWFGNDISLQGNYLVIGEYGRNQGATDAGVAHVYFYNGVDWIRLKQFLGTGLLAAAFGFDVSLSGNTIAISEYGEDKVYVYTGTQWDLEVTISGVNGTLFGRSLSLYENTLVVGATNNDTGISNGGAALYYERNGTTWNLIQTIIPSIPETNAEFGYNISLYRDKLLVSAQLESNGGVKRGAVYYFVRNNSTNMFEEVKRIVPPTSIDDQRFGGDSLLGNGLYINDDMIIIGAYFETATVLGEGAFYTYIEEQL